jgi:chromosome partitioning protein
MGLSRRVQAQALQESVSDVVDRQRLRRTVAVINGKGGVGKTSITANLAGLFAASGYRVLAVDLDPQGNLGSDLGYLGAGLSDGGASLRSATLDLKAPETLAEVRPGLDVVPGGEHLHDLAAMLQARSRTGRGGAQDLAATIGALAGDYDLTLLDCPPGSDVLQEGALHAARWALVPTKTDDASRAGLRDVARRFSAARSSNPDLAVLGVVLFGVNTSARRVLSQAKAALEQDLGGVAPVLDTAIRHVEAAAVDARGRGQLVHELERDASAAPKWYERLRNPGESPVQRLAGSAGALASDYEALAEEVLTHIIEAESASGAA